MAMSKGFSVLEKSRPPKNHSVLLQRRNKEETLLFESQAVTVLSPSETETVKREYTKVLDAYGSLGVLQIYHGDTIVLYLVMITGCFSIGKIGDSEIFRITQTQFVPLHYTQNEDRVSEVRKLLNSGTFYFVWNSGLSSSGLPAMDITLCAQRRHKTSATDNRFFWNRMLHVHLVRYGVDCGTWLLKAMCGSVEIRTVYVGHKKAMAAVISRLSCERAGTRFNVRGTNDEGHVANFVETEQVIYCEHEIASYLQTRGSVPLFWEQPGVQVGSHKVRISRGYEASSSAFNKHMITIKERYGKQVIVNLLGTSMIGAKEGEATLSQEFQNHHKDSGYSDIPHIVFDYHQECRGGNQSNLQKLKSKIEQKLIEFSFYHSDGDAIFSLQSGTIRTNCLDCLDRTNCVQTFIGLDILGRQLQALKLTDKSQKISRFEEVFKQMWINNGNEVSKIYAGTGAIQGGSKLMDGARSAARTIQNNLLDNSKQEAIDILLVGSTLSTELADRARILLPCNTLHAPPHVLREMCKRYLEYTQPVPLRVAVATYNVNGGKQYRSVAFKESKLSDWLLDGHLTAQTQPLINLNTSQMMNNAPMTNSRAPVDIYAIGFEEIVDLNAANIVNASNENTKSWASELEKVLSRDVPYVLVTYQQLVGVCLYIFVRAELCSAIRDVAVDSVKTGMGGHTGNKGAAAIRLVCHATSLAFVCAHFAAGQSQVSERNADYNEITRKITFPMSRSLNSHDYLFWCGDFNYRIDMDKDEIKECVKQGDLERILEFDQLKKQQSEGNVFKDFIEGTIAFPPTYKYDLFSDDYDTSEKARAPAWTDRVLWKRRKQSLSMNNEDEQCSPVHLFYYGRAELKQSDHRPVIAIIDMTARRIDEAKRELMFCDVIQSVGPADATIAARYEDVSDCALFEKHTLDIILEDFNQFGETILVRFLGDTMWVTFRDGESVLKLMQKTKGRIIVEGRSIRLVLKTPNWIDKFKEEIKLCTSNTIPLYYPPPQENTEYNCLGIPEVMRSVSTKSGPPDRPPPPSPRRVPSTTTTNPRVSVNMLPRNPPPLPPQSSNYYDNSFAQSQQYYQPSYAPPPLVQPTLPILSPSNSIAEDASSAIYEEIIDDFASFGSVEARAPQPPPPPPRPDLTSHHQQQQQSGVLLGGGSQAAPPPVPARSAPPPPLPARPR